MEGKTDLDEDGDGMDASLEIDLPYREDAVLSSVEPVPELLLVRFPNEGGEWRWKIFRWRRRGRGWDAMEVREMKSFLDVLDHLVALPVQRQDEQLRSSHIAKKSGFPFGCFPALRPARRTRTKKVRGSKREESLRGNLSLRRERGRRERTLVDR